MIKNTNPVSSYGQIPSENILLKVFVVISRANISVLYFNDKEPIAFMIFRNNTENATQIVEELGQTSQKIEVVFDHRIFSLFPTEIINDSNKIEIANSLFDTSNQMVLLQEVRAETKILFTAEKTIYDIVKKYLPSAKITHYSEIFLQNSMTDSQENEEVFFDIRDGYFYAALIKNKKLQLLNSFDYRDKNEFGFYSLGTIKNLGFDAKLLQLHLSGAIETDSPLQQLLNRYLANIKLPKIDLPNIGFMSFYQLINFVNR